MARRRRPPSKLSHPESRFGFGFPRHVLAPLRGKNPWSHQGSSRKEPVDPHSARDACHTRMRGMHHEPIRSPRSTCSLVPAV